MILYYSDVVVRQIYIYIYIYIYMSHYIILQVCHKYLTLYYIILPLHMNYKNKI